MNPSWIHLGRWFQTRLYRPALAGYHPTLAGTPPEEGNWNHLGGLFPTPLYHGSVFGEFSRTAELAACPCFKINDLRHCQIVILGRHIPMPHGISD